MRSRITSNVVRKPDDGVDLAFPSPANFSAGKAATGNGRINTILSTIRITHFLCLIWVWKTNEDPSFVPLRAGWRGSVAEVSL